MAFRLWSMLCKLIQRQTYTCLSTRYGVLFTFLGLCGLLISAFHFGEVLLTWSMIRYAGRFHLSRYYDNIGCKSFETRLCLPQPIDVVYTWVNGSDPVLISQLNRIKKELREQLNRTSREKHAMKKKRGKLINSEMFKWKSPNRCPFPNCVPANKIAVSGLPRHITLFQVKRVHALFMSAITVEFWDEDVDIAFVKFISQEHIHQLLNGTYSYKDQSLNISEVFYTSTIKNGFKRVSDALMIHDVVENVSADELIKQGINSIFPDAVTDISLFPQKKLGVLHLSDEKHVKSLKERSKTNLTIDKYGSLKLFPATYVWMPLKLTIDNQDEDFSSNRFADNNELKYSLRSVERFAPWVRKIFIVTNGQIPNWLNLDHPRITLVTHEELFLNKSHLPTFSSPAIETHIHRIPGLSKKFIYMNDDVFFGSEVWPDDFFTHSKGHKIYLSWAVPNCNEGCPASWINDKYCDKACNVSSCDWDGGDCIGDRGKKNWQLQSVNNQIQRVTSDYCAPGCALNWVGDRYCDGNCNHLNCAYDGADCGVQNFHLLFSHTLTNDIFKQQSTNTTIAVPTGTFAMYINLTDIFDSVLDGNFEDTPIIRNAVLSKKFKVLSLTFFKNISQVTVNLQVLGFRKPNSTDKAVAFFTISVGTEVSVVEVPSTQVNATKEQMKEVIPKFLYERRQNSTFLSRTLSPSHRDDGDSLVVPKTFFNESLPNDLLEKLDDIKTSYENGELTEHGYKKNLGLLYQDHLQNSESKVNVPGRKLLWITGGNRRSFKTVEHIEDMSNYLPWEKGDIGKDLLQMSERVATMLSYRSSNSRSRRHLLDAYSSSLLHVSRIYNKAFGYKARKVPAHMPHMVDRDIIYEMQQRFWKHFDVTSSHQLRHPEDMQFAFSFNYFVVGVKQAANISALFEQVDTDGSGVLSDRELRTLTAVLYPLPLSLNEITDLENRLKNCSVRLKSAFARNASSENNIKNKEVSSSETYVDGDMPLVTRELFVNCHEVWRMMNTSVEKEKYKHELMGEEDLAFKMIRNNVSHVLHQLDWIRKHRRKFVCVNDDLDHEREDSKVIRKLLKDFYESFFPIPSQFELKSNQRNRFLYKRDLDAWNSSKKLESNEMNQILAVCIFLLMFVFYFRKILGFLKNFFRRFFNPTRRRWSNDVAI